MATPKPILSERALAEFLESNALLRRIVEDGIRKPPTPAPSPDGAPVVSIDIRKAG